MTDLETLKEVLEKLVAKMPQVENSLKSLPPGGAGRAKPETETQVVYLFKLRADRPEQYQQLRLSYILGVLNSRMMLYRYYKALGDVEWKSFPYMTQKTIMGLPVRRIDFTDIRQSYFHNRIADMVDEVIASARPPNPNTDSEIERLVRELYEVNTPAANMRIDSELERISRFGSLLASSMEDQGFENMEE